MSGPAVVYDEGDRCEVCGYWWWSDGQWHSLVPVTYADTPEEARWVRCPEHWGVRSTPARLMETAPARRERRGGGS